jgi:hypothetical protein
VRRSVRGSMRMTSKPVAGPGGGAITVATQSACGWTRRNAALSAGAPLIGLRRLRASFGRMRRVGAAA